MNAPPGGDASEAEVPTLLDDDRFTSVPVAPQVRVPQPSLLDQIEREFRLLFPFFGVVAVSAFLFWLAARGFDAGRGDFFYLADAFLHGRVALDFRPGPNDVILGPGDTFFVPFAPLPAIALMPLVAIVGPETADHWESGINALIAGLDMGLAWILFGRLGMARGSEKLWLVALLGFSTQVLWVVTRGGVWHTGHLIALGLTLAALIEVFGRRQRPWLVGLLLGAAFLTRAPLAFAIPFVALLLRPGGDGAPDSGGSRSSSAGAYRAPAYRSLPIREWALLGLGVLPSIVVFFWYNVARFGDPLESGYALATLPDWLEARRELGLFSLAHLGTNLDYFLFHLPSFTTEAPFFKPDGLGLSLFLVSPGLLLMFTAPWREPRTWWLAGAALFVLIPSLLYYGGGWLQFGFRYFLDSVPFVLALGALGVARAGVLGTGWKWLITFGLVVNAVGVYWAYQI